MNKKEKLDILLLLSALESWAFAQGKIMPDYLHEKLQNVVNKLSNDLTESER